MIKRIGSREFGLGIANRHYHKHVGVRWMSWDGALNLWFGVGGICVLYFGWWRAS